MKVVCNFFCTLIISVLIVLPIYSQNYKIKESSSDHIILEFNFNNSDYVVIDTTFNGRKFQLIKGNDDYFRNPGEPWLPKIDLNIGIPYNAEPTIKILGNKTTVQKNKFIIPFPKSDPQFDKINVDDVDLNIYSSNRLFPFKPVEIEKPYIFRYAKILPFSVSPFQFNPVTRLLVFNKKVTVKINYNIKGNQNITHVNDAMSKKFLENSVLNFSEAQNWLSKPGNESDNPLSGGYWYDPNKNYFKIYLKEKGVYRVTYDELVSAGVPLGNSTPVNKLEIFNDGNSIPVDVKDNNGDNVFNSGDYLQFVGYDPPPVTPKTHTNIYNLSNVYWFSYQSDSTGNQYKDIDGLPNNWVNTYQVTRETIHFEKDSIYERLGYTDTLDVDHWYWGKATAQDRHAVFGFEDRFSAFPKRNLDSNWVTLRVGLQGMTKTPFCNPEHKAEIYITQQLIGNEIWDGQNPAEFEKKFYVSPDSIQIFPTGNIFNVFVRGTICPNVDVDEIRINWYEFEYWKNLKTEPNHFTFKSFKAGVNRFWTFGWQRDNMSIYIPEKNKLITNPNITHDQFNSVLFQDTSDVNTEYFLVSNDYYLTVDSIVQDQPSNLRDVTNAADYIIITYPDFLPAAEELAQFRANNFPDPDIDNARTKVVDVMQIYDEFSYGLMTPFALQKFVKYAFENWQSPAPSYVVLMGDMSYDYRGLEEDSEPNFIPSIPFFAHGYGEVASDNMIVAVSGEGDIAPDLAIGRMSCETLEEANELVNKVELYPADNSKPWREKVLLFASGLSIEDENQFGFNDASLYVCNTFVRPFGYKCNMKFNFPTKPEHEPYAGGEIEMREAIDEGGVLLNYYGHGGGLQWDLVFTDDDIDLLNNGGMQPFVISVTCYTAHFDNQKVFGEHFNLLPGRGSIGFFGSSGLTYWGIGKSINNKIFGELFIHDNYIIGKAILNAKNLLPTGGLYGTQIALLTYLGDPAVRLALPGGPDFVVNSSDIKLSPENPLVGDTVGVKINVNNFGRVFPNDSVTVELFVASSDTNFMAGSVKLPSFGDKDSVIFSWVPSKGDLYTLTAKVNETNIIPEEDHSDNVASQIFVIFNLSEPNVLKPIDGFSTDKSTVDFVFSDIGHYLHKDLLYYIEIDTSLTFENPLVQTDGLTPEDAQLHWQSPNLPQGKYFWRAKIFDGEESGNWSEVRSFSITNSSKNGYYAEGSILKTFQSYNVNYSDSAQSLRLNTTLLPARPSNNTFIEDIVPFPQLPDSLKLTAITTDGTYLYFGNIEFFAGGKSAIYKVGTGHNSVKGQLYGTVANFYDEIENSIVYHSDGYLYVAIGLPYNLARINLATDVIDTIDVPPGLLRWDTGSVGIGQYYLTSDGQYIYNLAFKRPDGENKYTLRIFDPANNFALVKPDLKPISESYSHVSGFFVFGDYFYPVESFNANTIRRIKISDGTFEEEWIVYRPFQSYYSWCSDWANNKIYAGVYRASGFEPKFSAFNGSYIDASGSISTKPVGPVAWWNSLSYDINNPSPTGEYKANLFGFNSSTKAWDTILVNVPHTYSLQNVDAKKYPKLRLYFELTDSSFTNVNPMELKSVNFDYHELPDFYFVRNDMQFSPDSVLQGFPVSMTFKARDFGDINADSLLIQFYLNGLDTVIYSQTVNIPADSSSEEISYTIPTDRLLFENEIRALGTTDQLEYFNFNNLIDNKFFVVRDSVRPTFSVKFDGKEIINGDIISAKPDIMITLEDNSPLPLDTSYFTLIYDNEPLYFAESNLTYEYTPYPNSRAEIHWKPELPDGKHVLEVLAKDASGNFFDTTSSRTSFFVFNEEDLTEVYNYPNPFTNDTYFTFQLHGTLLPEKFYIKVYTIAGRLIREIKIPPTDLKIGFNKIYWDGKDQDGDEIANGVYLYKTIATFPDETKAVTQKLARVR